MDKLAVILDEGIASAWRRWVETVNVSGRTPQSRREVFDQMRGYFLEQREEMRQAALCWLRETCGASPPADLGLPTRLRLTSQGWTAVNGASLH